MKDINIAVIGWGFMGRTHTHALRSIPLMYKNLEFRPVLKCVCSGHMENAEAAMRDMGFESCTDDWHTILTREDIDAVSVCTPNALHEEMVLELLKTGKHLYIDKPLTIGLDSALKIQEAAKHSSSLVQMVMNNRFLPATMRAKQIVDEGRIGEVIAFNCRYLHSGSIDEAKPIGWKQGREGGVILDLASHALDLITWLVGFPSEASCVTHNLYASRPTKAGGVETDLAEDHALMTLRLKNGALGYCEASKISTGADDELTFEVYGKRGALRFNLMQPGILSFYDNTLSDTPYGGYKGFTEIACQGRYAPPAGSFLPPKNALGWDRGHIHCYYSFLNSIYTGTQPVPSIDEAVKLQALMDAAQRSNGKMLKFD